MRYLIVTFSYRYTFYKYTEPFPTFRYFICMDLYDNVDIQSNGRNDSYFCSMFPSQVPLFEFYEAKRTCIAAKRNRNRHQRIQY